MGALAGLAVPAKFIEPHIRFNDADDPEYVAAKIMAVTFRDMAPEQNKALAPTKHMPY